MSDNSYSDSSVVSYDGDHIAWHGYFMSSERKKYLDFEKDEGNEISGGLVHFIPARLSVDQRLTIFEAMCEKLAAYPQRVCGQALLSLDDTSNRGFVLMMFSCLEKDRGDLLRLVRMAGQDLDLSEEWRWNPGKQSEKTLKLGEELMGAGEEASPGSVRKSGGMPRASNNQDPREIKVEVLPKTIDWIVRMAKRDKMSWGMVIDEMVAEQKKREARSAKIAKKKEGNK